MDAFFQQFQLIHMLLPYFPATNRTLFSYILYYLEFQHLMKSIQVEQDLLAVAPANPKFPEGDAFIELLSRNLPPQEAQRIKQMMDMMKMMDSMKGMDPFQAGNMFRQTPPAPEGSPSPQGPLPTSGMPFAGNSVTPDLLKNMMSPKQQQLFEQYQAMFQNNASDTPRQHMPQNQAPPPSSSAQQPMRPTPAPPPQDYNPYDY